MTELERLEKTIDFDWERMGIGTEVYALTNDWCTIENGGVYNGAIIARLGETFKVKEHLRDIPVLRNIIKINYISFEFVRPTDGKTCQVQKKFCTIDPDKIEALRAIRALDIIDYVKYQRHSSAREALAYEHKAHTVAAYMREAEIIPIRLPSRYLEPEPML